MRIRHHLTRAARSAGPITAALFLVGFLAGCASSLPRYEGTRPPGDTARSGPSDAAAPAVRGNDTGAQVARQALAMLGAPYRYGGATPAGFDCSGLVQYAYQQLGLSVPRTTEEQYSYAQLVRRRNMQPGDLLFFQFTHTVSHVGIYLGEGRFVHAPTTGRNVEIMALDQPYYRDGFIGAGRLHARL